MKLLNVFNSKTRIASTGRQMWGVNLLFNFNGIISSIEINEFPYPMLNRKRRANLLSLLSSFDDIDKVINVAHEVVRYNGSLLSFSKDIIADYNKHTYRVANNPYKTKYGRVPYVKSFYGSKTILKDGRWVQYKCSKYNTNR